MAKTKVRYVPNRTFDKLITQDAQYRDGTTAAAEAVAKTAEGSAPRGFMGTRSTYGARWEGSNAVVTAGPGWHLVEFGTYRTRPHATLRKAVEANGLKLEAHR